MASWILYTIIAVQSVLLIASIYYIIKFGSKILSIQDAIQYALEVLDSREASMSEILKRPLYYDSPEIRRLYDDLTTSRNAVLVVANELVGSVNNDELAVDDDTDPNTGAGDGNVPV